ncbi:MAG: DNA polymerase I [Lachnospiraceae bacterium]|nr:DNA polymerase I [Lachnospiraceae bacterium]
MNKILLIDGNSILNRAYYGLPDLTTKDGRHTGAILGFINIMHKVLGETGATHIIATFDLKAKTFRHEMYAEYKGTRKPMPDELREQRAVIEDVLKSMNITIVTCEGYEADDVIGTLSRKADSEGYLVTILSGDRDLLQLATDRIMIKLPKTAGGKTEVYNYYADQVKEQYGVDPITFIDLKGLMGDASDNIPGVPGVGEKTAQKYLLQYGSLDGLYEHIDELKPGKGKDKLVENKELAYLSRELATIKLDAPVEVDLASTEIRDMFNPAAYDIFTDLELKSLYKYFDDKPQASSVAKLPEMKTELISDVSKLEEVLSAPAEYMAVRLFKGEDGSAYASICMSEDKAYIAACSILLQEEAVLEALRDKLKTGAKLVCEDAKELIEPLGLTPEMDIKDTGIYAYLLNPLADGYDYTDLALDLYGETLPGAKELFGKDKLSFGSGNNENHVKYMAYKTFVPFVSRELLESRLKEEHLDGLYKDVELPCAFVLRDMERYGIGVDKEGLTAFGEKLKNRIDELTKEIHGLAGEEFNINSTKALGEILFEKLRLKSGKKTKSGYSTSVEVLEKIKDDHEIVGKILEYRQLTKLNSTYVDGLVEYISEDGRIHGRFNQTVTATGRLSSTDPNLQNIPTRLPLGREIRKVFVPQEGYTFVDADYSQIELRVLAHMSGDETLIEAYNKGTDIHAITASEVFGVPIDEVDSLMRRKAKAVNFGIIYGISSFGLGQDLNIGRKEAEEYIEKYFATYGKVKGFMDSCVAFAKENGYALTMYGRRRPIPELKSSNFMTRSFGERAAMNSPIQGSAADIIKVAMNSVSKALKDGGYKSRLILQVHDELMIETALDELEAVKALLKEKMEGAAKLSVPLIVDVKQGDSWYAAK